jgi:hypothetical protein
MTTRTVKSAPQRPSGRATVKFLFTKSRARTTAGSDLVVKRFLARLALAYALLSRQPGHLIAPDVWQARRSAVVTGTVPGLGEMLLPGSRRRGSIEP